MGIRTATHESNAFPGVTTKLLPKYVDVVRLAVEEARSYLSPKCRAVVTGNPIREEMIYLDRNACRKKWESEIRYASFLLEVVWGQSGSMKR